MDISKESQYYKAYIAGYRDGVSDAFSGKVQSHKTNVPEKIPIDIMGLSTRARNCLLRVGCKTVADVLALDDRAVMTMRNLGPKSAAEIAQWLVDHYYFSNVWIPYL